jgi:nitrite reductase/ring-hydroxylating ferredoxin subunit
MGAMTEGPDLTQGAAFADLADGHMLAGHVGDQPVLLARRGDDVFALGSVCTHYGAPLADGLLVGDTLRCHWHHACFSLRIGEALRAPALDPLSCWRVERRDDTLYVRERLAPAPHPSLSTTSKIPASVVIGGAGAAGNAAAEMLRREGYSGRLTVLSADDSVPCDRPNLSRDFSPPPLLRAPIPCGPTNSIRSTTST